MHAPATKTKIEEILTELEPYLDLAKRVDAFTVQRWRREILKNMSVYPWAGYVALARLALIQWDLQGIHENFKKAINIADSAETRFIYANSLQLLGEYAAAAEQVLIASDRDPANLTILGHAIEYCQNAGRYSMATELIKKFAQRSPSKPHRDEEVITNTNAVIQANGISEDVVQRCNAIAFEVLRKHEVTFLRTRTIADTDEMFVMNYIDVPLDQDAVDRLDEELGVALFDNIPEFDPNRYWIGFEVMNPNVEVPNEL